MVFMVVTSFVGKINLLSRFPKLSEADKSPTIFHFLFRSHEQ